MYASIDITQEFDPSGNEIIAMPDGTYSTFDVNGNFVANYDANGNLINAPAAADMSLAGVSTSGTPPVLNSSQTATISSALSSVSSNPATNPNLVSALTGSGLNLNQVISTIGSYLASQSQGTTSANYLQQQLALARTQAGVTNTAAVASSASNVVLYAALAIGAYLLLRKK